MAINVYNRSWNYNMDAPCGKLNKRYSHEKF